MADVQANQRAIFTPDRRLRVFVSSTLKELAAERRAVASAITRLHMSPVMFELGARPHPPQELYRSYLEQSDIFVGIYGDSYGWIAPDMAISGLEDEYRLSAGKPRLLYVRTPAPDRDPQLKRLLDDIRGEGTASYRTFGSADELAELVANDLAVLVTERFSASGGTAGDVKRRRTVPRTPSSFVGRERELAELEQLVTDPTVTIVTLSGPGGVGKTRIALELMARTEKLFSGGTIIVWLDAIKDAGLVLQALAAELGQPETANRPLIDAIAGRLNETQMLVVLDNFEHVITAAPQLADLAAMTVTTKFLVTSRELLHVRGERAVDIDPLGVPPVVDQDAEQLATNAAVALFVDRARAVAPQFALTPANSAAIAEIVRRLDGLPLALELAAARVRVLPPQALVARLQSRLDLPGEGGRDLPVRQRTLRAAIDWSFRLLQPDERAALQRLSVFAGGAELEAAEAVLRAAGHENGLDLLTSLIDKSLLRRTEDERGELRLTMLAAIRSFALEQLEQQGEAAAARDLHAGYFVPLAAELAQRLHSAAQAECLATFEREHDNLQADLDWFIRATRVDEGFELANHLRWFWYMRGHLTTARHYLSRLLAVGGGGDVARGQTLITNGMMLLQLGDLDGARSSFETAEQILGHTGDADALAWARTGLGGVLQSLGHNDRAEVLQQQALATFRSEGDLLGQCNANTRMAIMSLAEGEYAKAEQQFAGSLAVRRQIGDPWGTSVVLSALATVRMISGDLTSARSYLVEALSLVREIGYLNGIAEALDGLGHIEAAEGEWTLATDRFREAYDLYKDVGDRMGMARARAHLARGEVELSDLNCAGTHALEAFDLSISTGDAASLAGSVSTLACVLAVLDVAEPAAWLVGAASTLRARHGIPEPVHDAFALSRHRDHILALLGPEQMQRAYSAGEALTEQGLGRVVDGVRQRLLAPPAGRASVSPEPPPSGPRRQEGIDVPPREAAR